MGNTALLLLDLQQGLVGHITDKEQFLKQAARCIEVARIAKLPVIQVRTAYRPGHPEINQRNFSASRIASIGGALENDPSTQFAPEIAPTAEDSVVTKRRTGPFGSSDLEVVLRGQNVDSLVIGGTATSGAVLSTVRAAADLDFGLIVLKDLCFDPDEEVNRILVEKVFAKQARVIDSQKWLEEVNSMGKK